jgi:thymidylate kinase
VSTPEIPGAYRTIVIEGCDGTGKSTLAEHLATEHGFTVIHSPRTPDHVDLAGRYRRILAEPGLLALDRAFVSELVYGPLYRGRTRMSWEDTFDLAESVKNRAGVFLHLTGTPGAVAARLAARDGHTPELSELTALIDAYRRVFATIEAHAPVHTLDIDTIPEPVTSV